MVTGLRFGSWQQAALRVAALGIVLMGTKVMVHATTAHHSHPLGLSSHLNRMVHHVQSSIWEKQQRLVGSHTFAPYEVCVYANHPSPT